MADTKDKWIQWVALTTTILAVCAAISSLKGGGYSTKVQLTTTQETSQWSFFQAKSIKQHVCEVQRDQLKLEYLKAGDPKVRAFIEDRMKSCETDIARYDAEKSTIQSDATALAKQQDGYKRHSGAFGLAVMLLQIAIMMSSVGALIKRKEMWVVGLGFGLLGLAYMANGFLLWF
jgi:hypothetical protein